jgi:L-fuconolactonase
MPDFLRIDAHIQSWNPKKSGYEWLASFPEKLNTERNLTEVEPQLEDNQVKFGLLIQAANDPAENDILLEACETTAWLKGAVGWIPLLDPVRTEEFLLTKPPLLKGLRHMIHHEANPEWLMQPPVIQSFSLLERNQMPFDVSANLPEHLDCILRLSEKYPDQKWCLNHLGTPPVKSRERWGKWGEQMKALAGNPNVFIKIAGLGLLTRDLSDWLPDEIQPYIEQSLEWFGTERAMVGSAWPFVELCGGYTRNWQTTETILQKVLSSSELESILGLNALRFYGLHLPEYEQLNVQTVSILPQR